MKHKIVVTIETEEEVEVGEVMAYITGALADKIKTSTQITVMDFGMEKAEDYESVCNRQVGELKSQLATYKKKLDMLELLRDRSEGDLHIAYLHGRADEKARQKGQTEHEHRYRPTTAEATAKAR